MFLKDKEVKRHQDKTVLDFQGGPTDFIFDKEIRKGLEKYCERV